MEDSVLVLRVIPLLLGGLMLSLCLFMVGEFGSEMTAKNKRGLAYLAVAAYAMLTSALHHAFSLSGWTPWRLFGTGMLVALIARDVRIWWKRRRARG